MTLYTLLSLYLDLANQRRRRWGHAAGSRLRCGPILQPARRADAPWMRALGARCLGLATELHSQPPRPRAPPAASRAAPTPALRTSGASALPWCPCTARGSPSRRLDPTRKPLSSRKPRSCHSLRCRMCSTLEHIPQRLSPDLRF